MKKKKKMDGNGTQCHFLEKAVSTWYVWWCKAQTNTLFPFMKDASPMKNFFIKAIFCTWLEKQQYSQKLTMFLATE